MVVENEDERHLQIASWAFPMYLLAISLFVVPIAVIGLELMPQGANPDLYVLTVPLHEGQNGLAMLAFLGGFSSATSMVIVATLALSTMMSNHIVMPVWLKLSKVGPHQSGDVRGVVIRARRLSILAVISLGYLYYRGSGGSGALAAIGLISFGGVAQFLPALLGAFSGAEPRAWGQLRGCRSDLWFGCLPCCCPALGLTGRCRQRYLSKVCSD